MRNPDQEGRAGKAWLLSPSNEPEFAASLASWVVNVPNAHPHGEWWLLSVVHLRELPGLPQPRFQYQGAEYELGIYTLDADDSLEPDEPEGYLYLSPADITEQFGGVTDQEASTIGGLSVNALLEGRLAPHVVPEWKRHLAEAVHHFHTGLTVLN